MKKNKHKLNKTANEKNRLTYVSNLNQSIHLLVLLRWIDNSASLRPAPCNQCPTDGGSTVPSDSTTSAQRLDPTLANWPNVRHKVTAVGEDWRVNVGGDYCSQNLYVLRRRQDQPREPVTDYWAHHLARELVGMDSRCYPKNKKGIYKTCMWNNM